jgi:hypothetical protein
LRERAQAWLRKEHYAPAPVEVGSRFWMLASYFVPLLHLDDHPDEDRAALRLHISLPATVEQFVRAAFRKASAWSCATMNNRSSSIAAGRRSPKAASLPTATVSYRCWISSVR